MQNVINRLGWIVAGVLALALVALAAGIVSGGPLDPDGAPAPTMRTLDELGAWDRTLASNDGSNECNSSRFTCVLGNTAALDRETGLVWLRFALGPGNWASARFNCEAFDSSGRSGFRLPGIAELETLEDSLAPTDNQFPPGGPFINVGASKIYWSSTDSSFVASSARTGDFNESDGITQAADKAVSHTFLCVRGPE